MLRNLYSRKFFAHLREGSANSARALVPMVLDIHPARSVIDVGCGIGGWVKAFGDQGVNAIGLDGDYVDRKQLLIPHDRFIAHDLNRELDAADLCRRYGDKQTGRFDLAISLEVAEHLSPQRSDGLVRDLTALADVVLFAAAVPFQGGAGHINERWQSWWAQKFFDNGYDPFDVLRRDIWGRRDIAWWYKQNTIVYVKRNSAAHAQFSTRFAQPAAMMFDLVHPELFRGKAARLKNGNIVQKVLNRFRQSARAPRAQAFETPLHGDESWHRDGKPNS
jgi:cyclopropane fatty-acyl-phospholipid synthase-like methyltransferase